jgi:excisionase family DNA binding protein
MLGQVWRLELRKMLLNKKDFDPLAYIENAFLDTHPPKDETLDVIQDDAVFPTISDYLHGKPEPKQSPQPTLDLVVGKQTKFRKTEMSAPRPRRAKAKPVEGQVIDPELQTIWETLPKSIEFLCEYYDDSVTSNYYRGDFRESRQDLIQRLLDPELSLEETSRLLGVCPATVRRYTNRGWLEHHRTKGSQRRFRLSNIVRFVEEHGRFPEE